MSDRRLADVRTIHPRTLSIWDEATCLVALEVARDLRSGAIPPEEYDQRSFTKSLSTCGTACCIAGHIALRMSEPVERFIGRSGYFSGDSQNRAARLFSGSQPSDPILAADAIERFVIDGSETPWSIPRRLD